MEGGALLTEEFKKFSQDYVMFLHITTRIPGRKHEGLFGELGFTGFPTLAMLGSDGGVVARHSGPRNVDGFRDTARKAKEFLDIKAKAEAGDASAKIDYAVRRAEMGQAAIEELEAALESEGLTDEQRTGLKGALANMMVDEIQKTAAAEKYLEMLAKGLVPTGRQSGAFWQALLGYADYKKDADLFEKSLAGIREVYGSNPRAAGYLKSMEQKLAKLKAGK